MTTISTFWTLAQILCFFLHSSEGDSLDFLSLCDMSFEPGFSTWQRNTGVSLETWIRSVIPFPSDSRESKTKFVSSEKYLSVSDVTSVHGLRWRAYGEKYYDGWLYGPTDSKGSFQPGQTIYIFPDFITALKGTFENEDKLVEGHVTKITHHRCRDGVMELKVQKPESGSTTYSSFTPNERTLSPTPRVRDPQDKRNVYVGPSQKYPELRNEDSLFARRDFAPHSHVSYYLGYFLHRENFSNNSYSDSFVKNLMSYNETTVMNMPEESADLKNFFAVLGHKINHSFLDENISFFDCKHPVYGEIRCLGSIKGIQRGEELFANYGYDFNQILPPWYLDLYESYQNSQLYKK